MKEQRHSSILRLGLVCALALVGGPTGAVTYLSVEPIPSGDVVGQPTLDQILAADFEVREAWAELLVGCGLVDGVIEALDFDRTITSINGTNTIYGVAAGGFEGQTNPTYVFTLVDSGINAINMADVETLVNALGYVMSQDSTAQFSADNRAAFDYPLDYVTVNFSQGPPSGDLAQAFFEHVGTVDPDLFTGDLTGYTRIGFALFFLQPATGLQQFIDGMYQAAQTFPDVVYSPLDPGGSPTTALAGAAFRSNDWLIDTEGEGYLANIGQAANADLGGVPNLGDWRRFHLRASRAFARLLAAGGSLELAVEQLGRIYPCSHAASVTDSATTGP